MFVVSTAKGYGSFGKLVYVAYKEFLVRVDESSHLKRGDPRGDRGGQGFILEGEGANFQFVSLAAIHKRNILIVHTRSRVV